MLEFGIKRENEERRDGACAVVFSPSRQKYAVGRDTYGKNILRLFGGGYEKDEEKEESIKREIKEESGLYDFLQVEEIDTVMCHYANSLRGVNRVAESTCFLVILKSDKTIERNLESHEKFELVYVDYEDMIKIWKENNSEKNFDHWLHFIDKARRRIVELGYGKVS
ncbi:MAG: NUDIX domain-containing protein [Candidatus Paceibacterota bacterium]|jgi:8-oxo-dGTP pyrophosphatase MutT (NUDIX family)